MRALIISLMIFFSFSGSNIYAQLSFEGGVENSVIPVSYINKSIDMFAVKNNAEGTNDGKVVLSLTDAASWTVKWEKKEGNNYIEVFGYVLSDNAVYLDNQGDGIYKVTATGGGEPVDKYFAIVNQYIKISDKDLKLEVKNPDGCDCINIQINNLSITKPDFFKSIVFTIVDNYELLRSGETIANVDSDIALITIQDCDLKLHEVTYRVKITDRYGFEWLSDFINFKSKVPKAMFSLDPVKGEAPLDVDFTNQSDNADAYSWYVYKDLSTLAGVTKVQDSLWIPIDNNTDLSYKYKHPGKYAVKLIATNTSGINQCKSEYMIKIGDRIAVDSSLVQVPNVFTPNGDGKNDIFRVKAFSLKSFHGVVFNRLGRKVYEWDDPKGGWNGKIGGSYATPGTYFFVIEAVGTEQKYKRYVKKGTVLLIRER